MYNDYNTQTNGSSYDNSYQGTKYCSHCGASIAESAVICPHCGCQVDPIYAEPIHITPPPPIYVNYNYGYRKNKWIAFLLCFFLGEFGIHKFYEGRILMGVVYLLTGGLLGIGWLVDCIALLFKPNPYFV